MGKDLQNEVHHPYDKAYKLLLSSRELFAELLHSFVDSEWVKQISEEDLIMVDKSYVLSDYMEKESDIVYKAKLLGQEFYFYVLLELQSKVDFEMPHRLLTYMTEIWRDVKRNAQDGETRRKGYKLPAIVPIVLYNGQAPWTAVRSFRNMQDGEQHFGDELLSFRYLLIDVKRLEEAHLEALENLMALVFLVEQEPDSRMFTDRLRKSSRVLKNLSPELFQLFKSWFKMINPKETEQVNRVLDEFNDPKGADIMISNLTKILRDEYYEMRRKGLEDGLAEGMAKGLNQGISQGISQGVIQGRAEGETAARTEIARKLLEEGMSTEQAARISGLTPSEIEQLAAEKDGLS